MTQNAAARVHVGMKLSTASGATLLPFHSEDRCKHCSDGKGALLALLINSRLEARWLPHRRQVKTLPCRVHRMAVRHAASHQNQDVQVCRQARRLQKQGGVTCRCSVKMRPMQLPAWTLGALSRD